jgi:deoxycytidine triphosphate deaminase
MILDDSEILNLVNTSSPDLPLLDPFDAGALRNSCYNLRPAKAFKPKSGDELILGSKVLGGRDYWSIRPSETLVVMTRECLNLPEDLMGQYGQLNSLARHGLLLINASIIEPGYQGPLSCFLVNFSRETVHLYPNEPVAKIHFQRISQSSPPSKVLPLIIQPERYQRDLAKSAQQYPISFMDIGGVEERVTERVTKGVSGSIKLGVGLLAVLAFWSALEPLTNRILPTPQRVEMLQLRQELDKTKAEMARTTEELKTDKRVSELEEKLKQQEQSGSNRKKGAATK